MREALPLLSTCIRGPTGQSLSYIQVDKTRPLGALLMIRQLARVPRGPFECDQGFVVCHLVIYTHGATGHAKRHSRMLDSSVSSFNPW